MLRALIIKTSSLGDVVHTMAAVTDAATRIPGIRFDWVVEEAFATLPALHPAIERVIPVAIRRWRQNPLQAVYSGELIRFCGQLRVQRYDRILDAQGLIKSAFIARMAKGARYGLDRRSAREPLASLAYHHRVNVSRRGHAILVLRKLFSECLGYPLPSGQVRFGIDLNRLPPPPKNQRFVILLHGTNWASKEWPEEYWIELASLCAREGLESWIPRATETQRLRAINIAKHCPSARVLPEMELLQLTSLLSAAHGVVGVDTGLAHLAAALEVPSVLLFGATDPARTGARARYCRNLSADFTCAPCLQRHCSYAGASAVEPVCFGALSPSLVMRALEVEIEKKRVNRPNHTFTTAATE
jgi:heptosyltransferase-1